MTVKQAVTDDKLVTNALTNNPLLQMKVSETSSYIEFASIDDKLVTDALKKDSFVQTKISEISMSEN